MSSRSTGSGRNARSGGIAKQEEICRCHPWKLMFSPVSKPGKVVPKTGRISVSPLQLQRLAESIEEEFGGVDHDSTSKARGLRLKDGMPKPDGKSEVSLFTSNGSLTSARNTYVHQKSSLGGCAIQSRKPSKSVADKREHPETVAREFVRGNVAEQTRSGSESHSMISNQEVTVSAPNRHLNQACHVLKETTRTLGWTEGCHENALAPIREEYSLRSICKGMPRGDGALFNQYLEDGVKLLEFELEDRAGLPNAFAAETSSDPLPTDEHQNDLSQAEDPISTDGAVTPGPDQQKLKTSSIKSALPATVGQTLVKQQFQDLEVSLAQQKLKELRLELTCATSSDFASGPQLDSSLGLSAPGSRDCASEQQEEFDTELAEKQLEALLIPPALHGEPSGVQTFPRASMPISRAVQVSEEELISGDVARQPCPLGSRGYIAEPELFYDAFGRCKLALHCFYRKLVKHYKAHEAAMFVSTELPDWPMQATQIAMLRAVLSKLSRSEVHGAESDEKLFYTVQGLLNARMFLGFDQEGYGLDDEAAVFSNPASRQITCMEQFNAIELSSDSFKRFRQRKIELIAKETGFPVESWPQILNTAFNSVTTMLWKIQKLAFAFEPPVTMFQLRNCLRFDPTFMEPHSKIIQERLLSGYPSTRWTAEFMVIPGFHVQDRLVVKSLVYCIPAEDQVSSLSPGS